MLEIGARYGSSTIQALKKITGNVARDGNQLRGKYVAIEIDQTVLPCLHANLAKHGYSDSEKLISTSALSMQPSLSFVRTIKDNGYASHVMHTQDRVMAGKYAEYTNVPTMTLSQLKIDHGVTKDFNVIIADCEGSFQQIVTDFPDIVGPGTDAVILERDAEFTLDGGINCDYNYIHAYINEKGLLLCEMRNNYLIYLRADTPSKGFALPQIYSPHAKVAGGACDAIPCTIDDAVIILLLALISVILIIVIGNVLQYTSRMWDRLEQCQTSLNLNSSGYSK